MKPTKYEDINKILVIFSKGISEIFGNKLIGIYLFGSLTYGDFNSESSDIDLVTILKEPADSSELKLVEKLHKQVEQDYPKWFERVEGSYTPQSMLTSILPPTEPRPYFGEGIFYPEAPYGNEWIINQYLLYNYGVAITGPSFKTLIDPINIKDVQEAAIRDLFKEWEPKLRDENWLENSHYQSYLVLNLCRILYTVLTASAGSKKVSAHWVKNEFPDWTKLIEASENWRYGLEMNKKEESLNFLRFVMEKVRDF